MGRKHAYLHQSPIPTLSTDPQRAGGGGALVILHTFSVLVSRLYVIFLYITCAFLPLFSQFGGPLHQKQLLFLSYFIFGQGELLWRVIIFSCTWHLAIVLVAIITRGELLKVCLDVMRWELRVLNCVRDKNDDVKVYYSYRTSLTFNMPTTYQEWVWENKGTY